MIAHFSSVTEVAKEYINATRSFWCSSTRDTRHHSERTSTPPSPSLFLIRILGTLIYYLPRFTRPHKAWTYRQVIGVRLYSLGLNFLTAIEYRAPKILTPGREGNRFIIISPPDTAMSNQLALHYSRSSILTNVPSIRPVPIGAVWHPALPSSKPARVVLHFHGGAYVVGGVRLNINGWSPSILSDVMKSHVMLPQYRLSMEENASFPAALQDGITAYVYLLEKLDLETQNIILSGDSAGGNLVLSMIRYFGRGEGKRDGRITIACGCVVMESVVGFNREWGAEG